MLHLVTLCVEALQHYLHNMYVPIGSWIDCKRKATIDLCRYTTDIADVSKFMFVC